MPRSAETLALLLLLLATPASFVAASTDPSQDGANLPAALSTAIDSELSDGDESLDATIERYEKAPGEVEALRELVTVVNLHRRRGDYSDGLAKARDGLSRAREARDERLQVDFLYLLGRLFWNLTDSAQSIEYHLEELKLAQAIGDPALLARTHGGLGLTYQRSGRDADALHHFELGLELSGRARDDRQRASILNSLGNYHLGKGDHAGATAHYDEALRIRERFGNRRAIAETLTNLGLAADARGDYAVALDHLGRALETFQSLKYRRYIANTHRRLARVLRNAGRTDEALQHLEAALVVAETLESAEVVADIHQEFALTHEARGEFANALDHQRRLAATVAAMNTQQDRERIAELQARYQAEQRDLEIALLRRDQELQAAEIKRQRFRNIALGAGLIVGIVVFGAIIAVQRYRLRTERRLLNATENARERAEAAERLKTRLLQIASHDLKVPLTALNTTAGLIGAAPQDTATVKRLADGIRADTARMRALVRDFLDAAAIEAGNLQLHTDELDLGKVARGAIDSLQVVAGQRRQKIRFDGSNNGVRHVRGDKERLRQVFDNLVGNALKYSPEGGDVEVAIGESGTWVYAEIKDSGPGLGPDDFARIFAPFPRLSAKPSGDGNNDSTGLGLFIARELLALQGGRLEVQSRPGHGSVFRVLMPAAGGPADSNN